MMIITGILNDLMKNRVINQHLFLFIFFVEWLTEVINLTLIYLDRVVIITDLISLLVFPMFVLFYTRGVVDKVPLASIRGICLCYALLVYLPAHIIYDVIEYNFYVEAGAFESTPTTILSKVFTPIFSSLFSVSFCMEEPESQNRVLKTLVQKTAPSLGLGGAIGSSTYMLAKKILACKGKALFLGAQVGVVSSGITAYQLTPHQMASPSVLESTVPSKFLNGKVMGHGFFCVDQTEGSGITLPVKTFQLDNNTFPGSKGFMKIEADPLSQKVKVSGYLNVNTERSVLDQFVQEHPVNKTISFDTWYSSIKKSCDLDEETAFVLYQGALLDSLEMEPKLLGEAITGIGKVMTDITDITGL